MLLRIQHILSFALLVSISMVSQSAEPLKEVSVQEVTRHYLDSQKKLQDASKIKSIDRALKALSQAEAKLKEAKAILKLREVKVVSEQRMNSRLLYKIDQDIMFLNNLKADLGMAESDSFESYLVLRRSLLKNSELRIDVVRMDYQILLTLEARSFN